MASRSYFANEPPFAGQIFTLLIGLAGALGFRALGVPGGALSGSMAAVALLTIPGKATSIGTPIRTLAMILSGISIGAAVTPETLRGVVTYPLSLLMMTISSFAATIASTLLLMRLCGWNKATSLLASTPGGFSAALVVAASTDADVPRVVIVQMSRVFLLMAVLPMIVVSSGAHLTFQIEHAVDPHWMIALMTIPAAALGWKLDRMKIAGGMFLGVMAVSGIAHGTGLAPGRPHDLLILASQVLIGGWIGSRFVGFNWRSLGGMLLPAAGSVAATLLVATVFAWLSATLLGFSFGTTIVAFSPGAFEAMTLLAFALGLDPLFTVAHHLWRLLVMTFAIPILVRYWLKDSMVRAKTRSFR